MRVAAAQERSHRCAILSVSRGLRRRRTNENAQVGGGNLSEDMSRKLKPLSPGEMIAEEFLKPLGMSNYRLAKEISVPARRIGAPRRQARHHGGYRSDAGVFLIPSPGAGGLLALETSHAMKR